MKINDAISEAYVPETAFGKWFLRSKTWTNHVLEVALKDLSKLLGQTNNHYPVVVDVGCGYGRSLKKLQDRFKPNKLIAMDVTQEMLDATAREAQQQGLKNIEYIRCSNSKIPLDDQSVDMLFCHQTFHHLIYQEEAIQEYFRILKSGGKLLFAESTKRYIYSWIIRYLFRHPMKVQKTAQEYIDLIKSAGFDIQETQISSPFYGGAAKT